MENGCDLNEPFEDLDVPPSNNHNEVVPVTKGFNDREESNYKPSSKNETNSELEKVKSTSKRVNELNLHVEGTNTKKEDNLKKTTLYCYANNFNNFWKWLYEKYPKVVNYGPAFRCIKSFRELKEYETKPIKFSKITSNMFFEYIGTNDRSKYSPTSKMVLCSLKRLFFEFNKKRIFYRLWFDITEKEISSDGKPRRLNKKLLLKGEKSSPPPAKRKRVIIDDDHSSDNEIDFHTQQLLFLKKCSYIQWEVLETMTPGMVYKEET